MEDLIVTTDSDLYRILNLHYNRSNQIDVCSHSICFSITNKIFFEGTWKFLRCCAINIKRIFSCYSTTKRSRTIMEEKHLQNHSTFGWSNSRIFQRRTLDALYLNSRLSFCLSLSLFFRARSSLFVFNKYIYLYIYIPREYILTWFFSFQMTANVYCCYRIWIDTFVIFGTWIRVSYLISMNMRWNGLKRKKRRGGCVF